MLLSLRKNGLNKVARVFKVIDVGSVRSSKGHSNSQKDGLDE